MKFKSIAILLPFISATVWLCGIVALLAIWLQNGASQYAVGQARIVYISDVAGKYKPLFITICCVTSIFHLLTLMADHILRKKKAIVEYSSWFEKFVAALAFFCGLVSCASLILLSIFDVYNSNKAHWAFTVIFVISMILSAFFRTVEILRIWFSGRRNILLLASFILKTLVVLAAVALLVAFALLLKPCRDQPASLPMSQECNDRTSGAAVCEWILATMYSLYIYSLMLDLTKTRYKSMAMMHIDQNETSSQHNDIERGNNINENHLQLTNVKRDDPYDTVSKEHKKHDYKTKPANKDKITKNQTEKVGILKKKGTTKLVTNKRLTILEDDIIKTPTKDVIMDIDSSYNPYRDSVEVILPKQHITPDVMIEESIIDKSNRKSYRKSLPSIPTDQNM